VELYVEELKLYNPRLSLVKTTGDADFFENHILDSLSPLSFFKTLSAERWADVGSGAGLPGILLAIALPDKSFTLIERSRRRSDFLEALVLRLKLENVRVLSQDLERVQEHFDAVVFRAFRSLAEFAPLLRGLLKEGGELLAYKGKRDLAQKEREEVAPLFREAQIKMLETSSQKERCLLVLTR
jgi:16S rRNA (guanine527-N7)-methyltransferase